MDSDFTRFATSVIPDIAEVRLYDETIEKVRFGHPEIPARLPSLVAAVMKAVTNPSHVERIDDVNYVFVDMGTTNASGDPLRVPVKRIDGLSARVKSFYFASGGRAARIIWRGTDG